MIHFRCWYCGKRYAMSEGRIGDRVTCGCRHLLRVPKRSGGNSRARTPVDWLVELVVYGGGGGLLGFGFGLLILSQTPYWVAFGRTKLSRGGALIAGLTLLGFLIGALGGERGINWIGRRIREREGR